MKHKAYIFRRISNDSVSLLRRITRILLECFQPPRYPTYSTPFVGKLPKDGYLAPGGDA